ncbi:outer membrane protein OmpA-like peptidoglycan-associated protein [Chitinophaga skermanii]|uniref:Outer membrane protein OmpA-like peptidoglycan-associated protein n=1 Tax=Chitinophaga skermanii TaxID=331697 RepID=A0A327Q226_9BACT|nr:OmpA family protein [Chitinophaga skermanii]RAI98478.1 outer membrane protein OmpA-like peptidoglycan-associated protein [Chitinophaga skermanii]
MASKKYLLLAGAMSLLASTGFAQVKPSYDALDSSKVPASRMAQFNSFKNNQSDYPAKPRDMWELGLHGGLMMIKGDVHGKPGFGGGVSLRKALGHTFSLRAEYTGSYAYGQDYSLKPTIIANGNPWAQTAALNGGRIVPNYKTASHQVSLDMIASLSNIMFYKSQPKVNWYVLAGYSLLLADVDVDALNGSGAGYDYSGISFTGKRKDILDALKNLQDKKYEQNAPSQGNRTQIGRKDDNQLLRHALNVGTGIGFKVSKRFNIAIEEKLTLPFDDYLDGYTAGAYDGSKDFMYYTNVRFNFNLGNANKRVEPLWWVNPMDFAYNELNSPRRMKLPTPVLPDSDGDGVTDQFDREPNTPAGAPVDVNGVARDTDGDGVPDYKDKQLITPTYCFPVDADGVGKCPDPECCKDRVKATDCSTLVLPSVSFKGSSTKVSSDNEAILASVAASLRSNPACNVLVTGHAGAKAKKGGVDLSSRRVDAVIDYLAEKQGIDRGRFIKQNTPGDAGTVDLAPAN